MMMMTMTGLSLTNSLFLWIPGKDRYRKEVGMYLHILFSSISSQKFWTLS